MIFRQKRLFQSFKLLFVALVFFNSAQASGSHPNEYDLGQYTALTNICSRLNSLESAKSRINTLDASTIDAFIAEVESVRTSFTSHIILPITAQADTLINGRLQRWTAQHAYDAGIYNRNNNAQNNGFTYFIDPSYITRINNLQKYVRVIAALNTLNNLPANTPVATIIGKKALIDTAWSACNSDEQWYANSHANAIATRIFGAKQPLPRRSDANYNTVLANNRKYDYMADLIAAVKTKFPS
jgi:hypothetical protein